MNYDSSFLSRGEKQLTPDEKHLIHDAHFAEDLMLMLKTASENLLFALPKIDPMHGDVIEGSAYCGIHSCCSEEKAQNAVRTLKEQFRDRGYLIFVFDDGEFTKSIAVIRGTDDLDILNYRKTDGFNQDLSNKDIYKKFETWNSLFGITVSGCGKDWVDIRFESLPEDLDGFVHDLMDFCPDISDKSPDANQNLKSLIQSTRSVFLWWD